MLVFSFVFSLSRYLSLSRASYLLRNAFAVPLTARVDPTARSTIGGTLPAVDSKTVTIAPGAAAVIVAAPGKRARRVSRDRLEILCVSLSAAWYCGL